MFVQKNVMRMGFTKQALYVGNLRACYHVQEPMDGQRV
ncbi:mCG1041603 [Mus musculus]|nr:mCG1041603 [Mus musculus]